MKIAFTRLTLAARLLALALVLFIAGCERSRQSLAPEGSEPGLNAHEKMWQEVDSMHVKFWGSKRESSTGLYLKDWGVLYVFVKPTPALQQVVPVPLDTPEVSLGDMLSMGIQAPMQTIEGMLLNGEELVMQWNRHVIYDADRRIMTFNEPGAAFQIGSLQVTKLVFRGAVLQVETLKTADGKTVAPDAGFITALTQNWQIRKPLFEFKDWFWKGADFFLWPTALSFSDSNRKIVGTETITWPVLVERGPKLVEFAYELSLCFVGEMLNPAIMKTELERLRAGTVVPVKTSLQLQ